MSIRRAQHITRPPFRFRIDNLDTPERAWVIKNRVTLIGEIECLPLPPSYMRDLLFVSSKTYPFKADSTLHPFTSIRSRDLLQLNDSGR